MRDFGTILRQTGDEVIQDNTWVGCSVNNSLCHSAIRVDVSSRIRRKAKKKLAPTNRYWIGSGPIYQCLAQPRLLLARPELLNQVVLTQGHRSDTCR